MLRLQLLTSNEDTNWYNRTVFMTEEEIKLLPSGFLKKYGSYLNFMQKMQSEAKLDENKHFMGYYDQIRRLGRLKTDQQK
jgi:hypothetical protein